MEDSLKINACHSNGVHGALKCTSQRSNAYPSKPSILKGSRFSSLSAVTPKLPLVPLQNAEPLVDFRSIVLPSSNRLSEAHLECRIQSQFDHRIRQNMEMGQGAQSVVVQPS
jgi:hypothetical protein